MASENGHLEVVELLIKAGADVNQAGSGLHSPLAKAAHKGHVEICSLLIDSRADLEHGAAGGSRALKIAVESGHRELALLLLKRGASSSSGVLGSPLLERLMEWTAEEMREKDSVVAESKAEIERLVRGIPEWCAQAASSGTAAAAPGAGTEAAGEAGDDIEGEAEAVDDADGAAADDDREGGGAGHAPRLTSRSSRKRKAPPGS